MADLWLTQLFIAALTDILLGMLFVAANTDFCGSVFETQVGKQTLGTLRYPGRGPGRQQPEVNSQGLNSNLHKCHAT